MSTPPVRVVVDEVVVRGLSRRDAERLCDALADEVAALAAAQGAPTQRSLPRLARRARPRGARPDPRALAREVAAALWEDEL